MEVSRDEKNDDDHNIDKLRDSVSLFRKLFLIYGCRLPEKQRQKLECFLTMLQSNFGTSDFSRQFPGNKLDKIVRMLNILKEKFISLQLWDDDVIVSDDTPDPTDLQSTIEGERRFNPSPPQFPIATTVTTRDMLGVEVIVIDDTPDPPDLPSTSDRTEVACSTNQPMVAPLVQSINERTTTIAATISNSEANCFSSIFQRTSNPPAQPVTTFSGYSAAIAETDNVDVNKLVALHGRNCNDPCGRKYTYQNPTLSKLEQRMYMDDELENAEPLPDGQKSKKAAVGDNARISVRNIVNGKRSRRVANLSLNEEQRACKKRILARLKEAPATAATVNKRQHNTPVKRQQQTATSGQISSPDGTFINYASGLGLRITRVFSLAMP